MSATKIVTYWVRVILTLLMLSLVACTTENSIPMPSDGLSATTNTADTATKFSLANANSQPPDDVSDILQEVTYRLMPMCYSDGVFRVITSTWSVTTSICGSGNGNEFCGGKNYDAPTVANNELVIKQGEIWISVCGWQASESVEIWVQQPNEQIVKTIATATLDDGDIAYHVVLQHQLDLASPFGIYNFFFLRAE